jgi:hypothetical protein
MAPAARIPFVISLKRDAERFAFLNAFDDLSPNLSAFFPIRAKVFEIKSLPVNLVLTANFAISCLLHPYVLAQLIRAIHSSISIHHIPSRRFLKVQHP